MYVYGPVPSRRLGRSLGVSPIPAKTCSYSCVYCQLGRTNRLQTRRESFYPKDDILGEIVTKAGESELDYITFAGDGEPTLCRDLGWLIRQVKENLSFPVAVITNGSLLSRKDVRQDLRSADVVVPSLDAGDERLFWMVNRPHRSLDYDALVRGLRDFRREFGGQMWLEVMLVNGLNDSLGALKSIKDVVDSIDPDRIYILTPIRPPAERWVGPPERDALEHARELFDTSEILVSLESNTINIHGFSNARQAVLEISARHPLRLEQAEAIEEELSASGTVEEMIQEGELEEVEYYNRKYLLPRRATHPAP